MDEATHYPAAGGRVDRLVGRTARLIGRAATLILLIAPAGCIRGSLATSTGPNGPDLWSADDKQQVHVGETVRFSFILVGPWQRRPLDPYGFADYCIADFGERRMVCEPDLGGHFRFSRALSALKAGDSVEITATAYRQYGACDFLEVGDTWLRGESPIDEPDRKVCDDSVTLLAYEAPVEIKLPGGTAPLDAETGKLELVKSDGTVAPVFIGRPGRPGFVLDGPDADGDYTLVYQPRGDEVNPSGHTKACFTIHDLAGHPHTAETLIPTP